MPLWGLASQSPSWAWPWPLSWLSLLFFEAATAELRLLSAQHPVSRPEQVLGRCPPRSIQVYPSEVRSPWALSQPLPGPGLPAAVGCCSDQQPPSEAAPRWASVRRPGAWGFLSPLCPCGAPAKPVAGDSSPILRFPFPQSQSTGAPARGACDSTKQASEQALPRAPGRSGVGAVRASPGRCAVLPVPPPAPLPRSPFPECSRWDWTVLSPPRALPVQDSVLCLWNLCP